MHGDITPQDGIVADGLAVEIGTEHRHGRQQPLDDIRPSAQQLLHGGVEAPLAVLGLFEFILQALDAAVR